MWETVKLGDVCKIFNGGTPKSNVKSYWEGDVKWLTPKDMGKLNSRYVANTERKITIDGLNNSSAKLVPSQSVILSCRAPIGHVFINEVEMSFNQGCKGLVPTDEVIVEYLYYFLFSSKQLLNDLGTGTTFKEISGKTLSNVDIPLPPLAEQQRIVTKLDNAFAEIDETIKNTELQIKNTDSMIESFKEKYFRERLRDFKQTSVGETCQFFNGKAHEKDISDNGNYIVINSKFISSEGKVKKYTNNQMFPLLSGDLVMVMSDVPNGKALAKTFLVDETKKYSLNQRICCIRSDEYNPYFLQSVINRNPHFLKFNNGENQTNLRKGDILECPLPKIQPEEQIHLNQTLSSFTSNSIEAKEIYTKKLINLLALKSAFLSKNFKYN